MDIPSVLPKFIKNKNKKKNDTRNKKVFDKFIKQEKDFIDDIFSIIKSFMIEPIYKKSYRFIENREIRCCVNRLDKTSFYIGKRYGNLIQVKRLRYHEEDVENPEFKMYKIITKTRNTPDLKEQVLYEYVMILCEINLLWGEPNEYGEMIALEEEKIEIMYNMVSADHYNNALWTETDEMNYERYLKECLDRWAILYGENDYDF
tara:strand:- start:184 stop:795 length:612 start_codon:yes stop_codon:yes gene_type:complete